jgi:hypothetical protein
MLKLSEFRHNHHPSGVKMLAIFIRRGIRVLVTAKSGEIAHLNRSMAHSGERENAGQRYCTSCVRHGPVSAQFSLRIAE